MSDDIRAAIAAKQQELAELERAAAVGGFRVRGERLEHYSAYYEEWRLLMTHDQAVSVLFEPSGHEVRVPFGVLEAFVCGAPLPNGGVK